ncbi:ferredoxin--nitrite reductase [Waterburya agarophytonicola K14]|uniref:Ferredoxin--nitrite reductase n=1 Tax=Waterburya agarophytonicola KI4 TaxID=2874699 RepID=A0A964BTG6_9CYAN|nr:ferredoxin--nitrite reductase [Waterburya agarophytonicola]MCC0178809.1 ferredoxin--nitrite reductase [Waterburya agarophytonicola KI4]
MTTEANTKIKLNKVEKVKAAKDGLDVKNELEYFAKIGWEAVDKADLETRLKWLGIFYRPVTPGEFMVRMRVPNGVITSEQMKVLAGGIERYGDNGTADITTRQNIQLRGVRLEDIPELFNRFKEVGLTSIQSGMDNVRNLTGSPVAGIDPDELIDTRQMNQKVQDMITNNGEGNYAFTNLPRKFNIAIEGARDNSIHAELNDLAYVPAYKDGVLGFNVLVGGYLSAQRCAESIPLGVWLPANDDDIVEFSRAVLTVYTQNGAAEGLRASRPKARMMWLIETWGVEKFRNELEKEFGKPLASAAEKDEITQDKKDHLGIHPQKQEGYSYVGLHVPMGRLNAESMFELARLAEVYGNGEIRLTVEQNAIIPYIANENVDTFLTEPLLEKFAIDPSTLTRSVISCTGAQYCNFAIIETKQTALKLAQELDAELDIPQRVRLHWTGCPNSCGQPQAGDIGLMGTKVRKDGKAVAGAKIYSGGKVGHGAELGTAINQGVALDDLKTTLRSLLIEKFNAKLKDGVTIEESAPVVETLKSDSNGSANGSTKTKIFLANSWKEAACSEGEYILDAAEKVGVEIESSCRAGTCGTCTAKVLKGEVTYEEDYDALRGLEAGEILTCCAKPVSSMVLDV